ncbi:hypothetical protein T12_9774 [Trichinella patagoniensis]|uniref:Uncharacterized protein n=1 Tax=Trichinella patagoniensis TaxID=990121 RepID=A0A0V0ZS45_9BILA|nr:hypothetical protein T12_6609 [Trichinella patagoniensis]KRY15284.1 hypothetical protein T12_9774 [Trichinella patagoniensis]
MLKKKFHFCKLFKASHFGTLKFSFERHKNLKCDSARQAYSMWLKISQYSLYSYVKNIYFDKIYYETLFCSSLDILQIIMHSTAYCSGVMEPYL